MKLSHINEFIYKLIAPNWNKNIILLKPVAILREQQHSNASMLIFYVFYRLKSTNQLPTVHVPVYCCSLRMETRNRIFVAEILVQLDGNKHFIMSKYRNVTLHLFHSLLY